MRKKRNRIEHKRSRTAEYTCLSRAAAYKDDRECYKGPDDVAFTLMPGFIKAILRRPWLNGIYHKYFVPKGIYEYLIARTKYIDSVFGEALEKAFDQIVIFGAGFDSRGVRFRRLNKGTRIFELDAPITQEHKLKAYRERNIGVPENDVFVPINFNNEDLYEKLHSKGFEKNKRTMFLLEGVTMYLSEEGIDATFGFMRDVSGKGSLVVFDYVFAGVLRLEHRYYGEREVFRKVRKAGEGWSFALEEGEIGSFLNRYGFRLKEHHTPKEFAERYFKNRKGRVVARLNGTHGFALGIKE